jgi:hypothetical protein
MLTIAKSHQSSLNKPKIQAGVISDSEGHIPALEGIINGQREKVIQIDTAASVNIADEQRIYQVDPKAYINKSGAIDLILADNQKDSQIRTLGTYTTTVSLGPINLGKVTFHVIRNNNNHYTLGIEAIRSHGMILNFAVSPPCLSVNGQTVNLSQVYDGPRPDLFYKKGIVNNETSTVKADQLKNALATDYNKLATMGRIKPGEAEKLTDLQDTYKNLILTEPVQDFLRVASELTNPHSVNGIREPLKYILWKHNCKKRDGEECSTQEIKCPHECGMEHPDRWTHQCASNTLYTTMCVKCENCDKANPLLPGSQTGTSWLHNCEITSIQTIIPTEKRNCDICEAINPNYLIPTLQRQKT